MKVESYLSFEGRCEEAIEFYKRALGAEVDVLMRFKDSPEKCPSGDFPPEMLQKVMHSSLRIGETTVMMSDGKCMGKANFGGISLVISVANDAEAERLFVALGEGGKVTMPLTKTFFSSRFGSVDDRFGVPWTILTQH